MSSTRRNKSKRKESRKKHMSGGSLRSSYGTVILKKGTRLYHTSATELCELPDKPVIFMTLHPSEWHIENTHVSVIELQRDVSLLFMVKLIHNVRIFSSLNDYLDSNSNNLTKMQYDKIKTWLPNFKRESLDGWMSSIENKTAIEFAIINDPSIIKLVDCLPIQYNWSNSTYNNNYEFVPKKWGTAYPLYTKQYPIEFHIHSRFRPQIESYKQIMEESDMLGTAFSVILENAEITYFDGPVETIKW